MKVSLLSSDFIQLLGAKVVLNSARVFAEFFKIGKMSISSLDVTPEKLYFTFGSDDNLVWVEVVVHTICPQGYVPFETYFDQMPYFVLLKPHVPGYSLFQ